MVWSVAGLAAGPVFGIAGRAVAHVPRRRPLAVALAGGTLAGEGAHLRWIADHQALHGPATVELVLGGALGLLGIGVARSSRRSLVMAVASTTALTVVGAFAVIDVLFGTLS